MDRANIVRVVCLLDLPSAFVFIYIYTCEYTLYFYLKVQWAILKAMEQIVNVNDIDMRNP